MASRRVAVVGAGWAGLSAAVTAVQAGHHVTVFEAALQPGGRARTLPQGDLPLDNGQHILIGAYSQTLALMQSVGVDHAQALFRMPLSLIDTAGKGLRLPRGPTTLAFLCGVIAWGEIPWHSRLGLIRLALGWRLSGFYCAPDLSVAQLCREAPSDLMGALIEPLCVAALNTSAAKASGQIFLNVLRDALFGPHGSADLLLPRKPLSDLLPTPAWAWLRAQGAELHVGSPVRRLTPNADGGWWLEGRTFDQIIVATPAREASKLVSELAPAWAASAASLQHEPIVTVWLRAQNTSWPCPMLSFPSRRGAPAQFGFDLGALGGPPDLFALVVSAASTSLSAGLESCAQAVRQQVLLTMVPRKGLRASDYEIVAIRADKRATFVCSPGLVRPPMHIAAGLRAAGDYVDGPYPATLEGAVRAGHAAANF